MKEYKLKTLAEINEVVTEKNIGSFLIDFSRWLGINVALKSKEYVGKVEVKNADTFHWIDDGKTDIKATIEIK